MTTKVAAIVLAAGASTRFRAAGGAQATKLLAPVQGQPMVRRVAQCALATRARPVIVVTGHLSGDVAQALAGLPVALCYNAAFREGLSTSLKAGIAATPADCMAAVVMLGDMPLVEPRLVESLIDALGDHDAVAPVCEGRRGNPVVLSRRLFKAIGELHGDRGAGGLLRASDVNVREVAAGRGVLVDVDTPDAMP